MTNLIRVRETEANWAWKLLPWPGLGQENYLRLPSLEHTGWSVRSRATKSHAEQGWGRQDLKAHNAAASYCVFSWFLPPMFLLKVCIFYLASGWAGTTGEKKMAVAQIFLLLASCHRQWIQGLDHCGKLQLGPQKRKSKKVIANQPGHMAFSSVWAGNFNRWENKITSLKGRACQKLGNPQAAEIPGQKIKGTQSSQVLSHRDSYTLTLLRVKEY